LWLAVASAVLVLAAFPPLNLGFLVFVGLVPLIAALRDAQPRRALLLGYVFGFVFYLVEMDFVRDLVTKWTGNAALAPIPVLLACLLGAWYFALFAWLAARCWQRNMPWLIPFLWIGIEVFRSYIPSLAFPWGLIASPLWPYPAIIQMAFYGGIFLVGFWVLISNVVLASWLKGES